MTSCSEHGMKDSGDESRLRSTEGRCGVEAGEGEKVAVLGSQRE